MYIKYTERYTTEKHNYLESGKTDDCTFIAYVFFFVVKYFFFLNYSIKEIIYAHILFL